MSESSKKNVGNYPRAKFKKWIAQILPDDPGSSKKVTVKLIETAKKKFPKLKILLLNGPKESGAAIFSLDKTPPIDYSVFSKVKHHERKKYDFNFDFTK